ncbi:MAG TPA: helicase-related protein [Aggregatilineales bacterium]|nr:helicase-related protein [Aggregatilineales bacterium]
MRIPYVIDNIETRLADVLNYLLQRQTGQQVDVATAYFSVRGYELIREALHAVRHFRLLLGDHPQDPDDIGLQPNSRAYLRHELNAAPLTEATQQLVEELVRFLRREDVEVRLYLGHDPSEKGRRNFLHAKCYLFYGGRGNQQTLFDYLNPLAGIVGSSNFTAPGLLTNRELNLVHKTLLDEDEIDDPEARGHVRVQTDSRLNTGITPDNQRLLKSEVGARAIMDLSRWYDDQWGLAVDFKEEFIALLENSKFGGREYTPYEIYMKALYEYFKDDLDSDLSLPSTRSAVELAEFQDDAVKKARRILARYDGVIVADSVGLGKTWIGKKLLEDYAYHQRQKAVVVCPASLKRLWEEELRSASISAYVVTQERLGQDDLDIRDYADADVILVDEAHNFRNKRAKRYFQLETILAANGRRGRDGGRKKLILLTATPINNNIFDLYNQINLFTGNDRTYFSSAGIGDLYKYFLAARRESIEEGSIRIFNLLEEVVIRRTRQFIQRAYPEATIRGKKVTWPKRQLRTIEYNLEAAYEGFYQQIVRRIEGLNLAHYNLESYKLGDKPDDFELGRQVALVGIFKSRFLKRLESSIDAFRISIRRGLEFVKTFDEYLQDNIVLDAASFQNAMRLLEEDDADSEDMTPASRASEMDAAAEARALIEGLPRLDPAKYDRRALHRALQEDIDALTEIWHDIKNITYLHDAKLERLKQFLETDLRGQKVLIFTYYKDTARYLYRGLTEDHNAAWLQVMGQPNIRRIDSNVKPADRIRSVENFAPIASGQPQVRRTPQEIDILISTDVLSEGQNLQDCGYLINYDLHWNPTRMVQRAGRIDRLGSVFETLTIYNLFPDRALEALLGLVKSLTSKIDVINQTGFLDASVLGEVVTPRDFNTLRRIADEDNTVIEEQEAFLELASSEVLLAQLQKVLATEARQWLTDLDDGIHSGLERRDARGMFFYFTALHPEQGRSHFWRYYDIAQNRIIDNRYQIMQIIACGPETPRFPPPYQEINVFEVQERVIQSILADVEQQEVAAIVAKPVAEEQNIVSQILQEHLNSPEFDRKELRELRKFLKQPLVGASVQRLRKALQEYTSSGQLSELISILRELYVQQGSPLSETTSDVSKKRLKREDLYLICYEYIWR